MFSILISVVVLVVAAALIVGLLVKDPISRQKRSIEEMEAAEAKVELIRKSAAKSRKLFTTDTTRPRLSGGCCGWHPAGPFFLGTETSGGP